MSGNADNNKKISLVTPFEIFGFIVAVILILYLLFPEDKLLKYSQLKFYRQLEKENLFLSIKFLEEMNREFPQYKDISILLIHNYIKTGKLEKAREKLDEYNRFYGEEEPLLLLKYELLHKEAFSYPEGSKRRKNLIKKMRVFIKENMKKFSNPEFLKYFYSQALSLNSPETALDIAVLLWKKEKDEKWLHTAEKLSRDLGKLPLSIELYSKLVAVNPFDLKYRKEFINLLLSAGRYRHALKQIESALKENLPVSDKIYLLSQGAKISIWKGWYEKASHFYIYGMKTVNDPQKKKMFFKKALNTLRSGGKVKEAVYLIKKYGFDFIRDKDISKLMIKTALEANDLKLAREISLRILGEEK